MLSNKILKEKKPKPQRYFDVTKVKDETDLEKVKLLKKSKQKFKGDYVKVGKAKNTVVKKGKNGELPIKVINVDQKNVLSKNIRSKLNDRRPKIPAEKLKKHSRGEKGEVVGVKTKFFQEKQQRREVFVNYAVEQAARSDLLLTENQGFLQADEHESSALFKQSDIVANVDIQAAAKHFKLNLDFGPYRMRYTKNGRDLLLGGRLGHVAAFDWVTKALRCEMNVMEEVADVSWLHVNTMFACAQKDNVFIYDSQGTELHCIKRLHQVNRLEFLPYHFLLACANRTGYLSWLDVSIGELVGNYNSHLGDIRLMCQNPGNGVICIGGGKGVVSMWSPKVRQPLATMLCHNTPMSAITVDPKGQYMVTAGIDRNIKVWDVRQLNGPLNKYCIRAAANNIQVSQRGLLAITQGAYCEIFPNVIMDKEQKSYLRHFTDGFVHNMHFCPYEDVLGVATANGFESLLVPGAGEPNFDALEDNPYQTKKQRTENEVHRLLEKIPAELITLDPNEIVKVDVPTLQQKVDAKRALFHVKPPKIDFKSRHKMKGRGGSVKAAKNKQIVKDIKRKEFINDIRARKQEVIKQHKIQETDDFIPLVANKTDKKSVLDRFKSKQSK